MTCSSKSAWKQIESWLSLLFKTTSRCMWLFKRYAEYFCAWHYAAMFFINIFKHFFSSLSWWMWLFSLMKWVFLHLFIMFLMSAWVRGCTIAVHFNKFIFSNCIRSASERVSLHFLFYQGHRTEVLMFSLITSHTFSFYLFEFSYCFGEVYN